MRNAVLKPVFRFVTNHLTILNFSNKKVRNYG